MASGTPNLDKLYQQWQQNKQSVPFAWQVYFARQNGEKEPQMPAVSAASAAAPQASHAQNQVTDLIQAYRAYGHKSANINPLFPATDVTEELNLTRHGLSESQLQQRFDSNGVLAGEAPLADILTALKTTYCSTLGVQYTSVSNPEEREWLRQRMESVQNKPKFSAEQKKDIANLLMKAEKFEGFLHTKYVGVKRFSAEGGEAMIPMLNTMINMCGDMGVEDVVMGMAHRGRLNVLTNIVHKPMVELFAGFNDTLELDAAGATSDVKYHMGKSYDVQTASGKKVHISLQNNPSHLEMVNPVVAGSARARIARKGGDSSKVLPVTIHGDSAFAGQGVVPETLNLANLKGYTVGGTMHLVINNQVGFTAEPSETFSGEYCTDVARMLQVPIFHVNGDDAEACVWAMMLAMDYRQTFKKDVVIDLVCYRKYGHNEGDDPTFTQPLMYAVIKQHKSPYTIYAEKLQAEKSASAADLQAMEQAYMAELQTAFDKAKDPTKVKPDMFKAQWSGFDKFTDAEPKTAISKKELDAIASAVVAFPKGFVPNSKVEKTLEKRVEMLQGKAELDWGSAEVAAYASLLADGYAVRISGQDVQRGTFSHRHIVSVDSNTGARVAPVASLATGDAKLEVHNSALSELAVLGFEYGHSIADPKCLTVWEAQFGDFANGAQIMIDQFISSSETKWHRLSGLTMLLPHGYEGMGPEHSSARLERYLQLCAQNNMSVTNPTTPAQIFHLLRRQMLRHYRRPLVVMSPKSLLRHPLATSTAAELTSGAFHEVLADDAKIMEKATKVVLCAGKVYYDLLARRTELKDTSVALIRLEQLYPVPLQQVQAVLKQCKNAKQFMWVQEDPRNQGAWGFLLDTLFMDLAQPFHYVGRPASASPAVGSPKRHKEEVESILTQVFSK